TLGLTNSGFYGEVSVPSGGCVMQPFAGVVAFCLGKLADFCLIFSSLFFRISFGFNPLNVKPDGSLVEASRGSPRRENLDPPNHLNFNTGSIYWVALQILSKFLGQLYTFNKCQFSTIKLNVCGGQPTPNSFPYVLGGRTVTSRKSAPLEAFSVGSDGSYNLALVLFRR